MSSTAETRSELCILHDHLKKMNESIGSKQLPDCSAENRDLCTSNHLQDSSFFVKFQAQACFQLFVIANFNCTHQILILHEVVR